MTRHKNWKWTDEPAVLRSRVTMLARELDEADERIKSLEATMKERLKSDTKNMRLSMDVDTKLRDLSEWYHSRFIALAPPEEEEN